MEQNDRTFITGAVKTFSKFLHNLLHHLYDFKVNTSNAIYFLKDSEVSSDCLAIEFINNGDTDAFINGRPLLVGSSPYNISVSNRATIETVYNISFDKSGSGVKPQVIVVRMFRSPHHRNNCHICKADRA